MNLCVIQLITMSSFQIPLLEQNPHFQTYLKLTLALATLLHHTKNISQNKNKSLLLPCQIKKLFDIEHQHKFSLLHLIFMSLTKQQNNCSHKRNNSCSDGKK